MAVISKIRSNSTLLIFLLGLGLAAFLMMDMFSGQRSLFGGPDTSVGEVNGEKITLNEFNRAEQAKFSGGNNPFAQKASTWNYLVEEKLIREASEDLGLTVTEAEKQKLMYSDNQFELSPVIRNIFMNPNTRSMDMNSFSQLKQNLSSGQTDADFQRRWMEVEKEVEKEALQRKYRALVTKGLYAPTWMVEQVQAQGAKSVSFEFVKIPFDEIADSEVTVSDADLSAYLKENEKLYTNAEETRTLGMVVIDVIPTKEDSASLLNKVQEAVNGFATSTNDSLYTVNRGGTITTFITEKDINLSFNDRLFNDPVGTIVGPIEENGSYVCAKILERKTLPDSVTARHILRRATDQATLAAAQKTIDSVKTAIEAGDITFADAAQKHSEDGSAPQGGDLGTFGPNQMVKPFNDMVFHKAEVGELNVVTTQFGVHLIEVTDKDFLTNRQGAQLAVIEEPIIPSETTQDEIYKDANTVIVNAENLEALKKIASEHDSYEFVETTPLKRNDYTVTNLGGGSSSRDMIRWAFSNASEGQISDDVYIYQNEQLYFNNKYAVAALLNVQPAGVPSVNAVRSLIAPAVKNQKKRDYLAGKIANKDLNTLAADYSTDVDTAQNVSFSSSFIPGVGVEPAVVSKALAGEGTMGPILGTNGLYVVRIIGHKEDPIGGNVADFRKVATSPAVSQVGSRLLSSLRKSATIEDNRFKFF